MKVGKDLEMEEAEEQGKEQENLPVVEYQPEQFRIDQRGSRLSLALICFGVFFSLIGISLHTGLSQMITMFATAPVVAFLLGLWYFGRGFVAVRNHITQDRTGYGDDLPSITVSIPAYNEQGTITETIDGIFEQARLYPAPVEVVVCDDGSSDDTWGILKWLSTIYDDLTVLRQENAGSAVARNTALSHGTNDIVLSMDADTVLGKDAIYEAGLAFRRNPDAVAVGTNVGVLNPKESIWSRMQVFNYLLSMELGRMFQSQLGYVLVLSGGCSVFRRDVIEEIDGWNDSQLFSDDYDLTVRVAKYGEIDFSPYIHAYTEVPTSFKALWNQRLLWRQRGVTVTLAHIRKQGSRKYGTLGLIGLPIRLALISVVFLLLSEMIYSIAMSNSLLHTIPSLLWSGTLLSTALMSFSLGLVVLVCRDRKPLRNMGGMIAYLAIYRWFLISVRFIGSVYGIYCYLLYLRQS